jgi:hypothetical protein
VRVAFKFFLQSNANFGRFIACCDTNAWWKLRFVTNIAAFVTCARRFTGELYRKKKKKKSKKKKKKKKKSETSYQLCNESISSNAITIRNIEFNIIVRRTNWITQRNDNDAEHKKHNRQCTYQFYKIFNNFKTFKNKLKIKLVF